MKKRFFNSKRILTLILALSLVVGEAGVVAASPVAGEAQTQTSVSANEVADSVEVQGSDISAETAYDGSVSKVIGVEGSAYTERTSNADGDLISEVQKLRVSWNRLSCEDKYAYGDKLIRIGYQVEINGKVAEHYYETEDGIYTFTSDSDFSSDVEIKDGETATFRVRGLYYIVTEGEGTYNPKCSVISVGAWSEPAAFTAVAPQKLATPSNIAVTALKTAEETEVTVTWDEVEEAGGYGIYMLFTPSPVDVAAIPQDAWDSDGAEKYGWKCRHPGVAGTTEYKTEVDFDFSYVYVKIYAYTASSDDGYIDGDESAVVMAAVAPKVAVAEVPQVQNFRVEDTDRAAGFKLAWTPISEPMMIYAVEKNVGFPAYYTYQGYKYSSSSSTLTYPIRAIGKSVQKDGTLSTYYDKNLLQSLDALSKAKIEREVQAVYLRTGNEGTISSGSFNLKPGVEYSFVAHTFDDELFDVERTPITVNGINFTRYTDVSPASAIVSAKEVLINPNGYIASGVDNLTISITGYGAATGFEIYRKTGKKYKKIVTTVDNVYKDENLKKNTKYDYRIRSYYYDKDTKIKCYSEYLYLTGETSDKTNFRLSATQKSKKSVTLKWTKVKGAIKYEIYRTNAGSTDPYKYSKKNSAGKKAQTIASVSKYELIKTIKKPSVTKYTDKKLTQGEDYTYYVRAYYQNGKSVMYMTSSATVKMYMRTPDVEGEIKGNSAKVSWDKDKFASRYEIKYFIYDEKGEALETGTDDKFTHVTTKGTSYTVSGIPNGGGVTVNVRACGGGKYTAWDTVYLYKGLDTAKDIKAEKTTLKNASGEDVDVVKITWSPVEGASYYKVLRATKQTEYNADTKVYKVPSGEWIAKESNDDEDEAYNEVTYCEYEDVENSVLQTTVYDYARLDAGVTYYYYVIAYGEDGRTAFSAYLYNGTRYDGSGKPAKIVYDVAVDATASSKKGKAVVSWDAVPGAKKYYVYRSTKKNKGYQLVGSTKKASYTDKKVKKGKTYYYKVQAEGTNALTANFTVMSSAKKIKVKK